MVKSKTREVSSLSKSSTTIDLTTANFDDQPYRSIDWTWSKIISVCLLGSVAFYSTHQIAWDSIKAEHIIAQPELNNNHYNNIISSEISSHLQKSRRSVEENQVHKLHESNSAMPGLDLTLFKPSEAVESHEIHKRAISIEEHEHNQEGNDQSKIQKFFYPDYEHIPLNKLETVQITNGKNSLTLYKQGSEEPPMENSIGMQERNFMITQDEFDARELVINSPSFSDSIKKMGQQYRPDRHYYGKDGLTQEDFLYALAESGADSGEARDTTDLEYYEEKEYEKLNNGQKMPERRPNSKGVRYIPSELPCLKKQEPSFEQWLKDQDSGMPFARSFPVDQATGHGGGNGKGLGIEAEKEKKGPPIGCCNGKPFSAKKRCCCRRKSYDTETEFCCVSPQGCAAFQTFSNTTDNRNACLNIGGKIVLNEYFDYQATPMIGWARQRAYGPAYQQSNNFRPENIRYRSDSRSNDKAEQESNKSRNDKNSEKNKRDRPSKNSNSNSGDEDLEGLSLDELEKMLASAESDVKAASPEGWNMDAILSSEDHMNEILNGANPFAWAGDMDS